jgi:hypothetical protein
MKQLSRMLMTMVIAISLVIFQSCEKDDMLIERLDNSVQDVELKKADGIRTFYGRTVPVGNGVARAWVKENAQGEPIAVGVNLSEKALENLPHHHVAFVLPFHTNKGKNFYDHVLLDWSPEGHEPPGIYDLPHFDIHFYITSVKDREAIEGLFPGYDIMPDSKYIPENFVMGEGIVPQMGAHWIDFTAPELPWNGGVKFTQTFIWGSYKGEFIFWEPMVTLEYLLGKPNVTYPVKQPQAYQRDGWYATNYKIAWSDRPGEYTIALTDLEWKQGE